jgi:hypothetical protein
MWCIGITISIFHNKLQENRLYEKIILRKAKPLTYYIFFKPMVQVENIVKVVCLTKMDKESKLNLPMVSF